MRLAMPLSQSPPIYPVPPICRSVGGGMPLSQSPLISPVPPICRSVGGGVPPSRSPLIFPAPPICRSVGGDTVVCPSPDLLSFSLHPRSAAPWGVACPLPISSCFPSTPDLPRRGGWPGVACPSPDLLSFSQHPRSPRANHRCSLNLQLQRRLHRQNDESHWARLSFQCVELRKTRDIAGNKVEVAVPSSSPLSGSIDSPTKLTSGCATASSFTRTMMVQSPLANLAKKVTR